MGLYDQLAFSSRPSFYLAAPVTTDQSMASEFVIDTNDLVAGGQPIIYGHSKSFKIESGATMDIAGNALFNSGETVEFILFSDKPEVETEIVVGDNGSGIFLNPNGFLLRLVYTKNGGEKTASAQLKIAHWFQKMHVVMTVGNNQVVLTANNDSATVAIDGDLDVIATTSIGKDFSSGFYFLMDGFGIYNGRVLDKTTALDDNTQGHSVYAAAILQGRTTGFDNVSTGEEKHFTLQDFNFSHKNENYTVSYHVPASDASYAIVESSDDSFVVDYDVNSSGVQSFSGITTIDLPNDANIISFRLNKEVSSNFAMNLTVINNADILSRTPAFLTATNQPIFPQKSVDSIVNCSPGVRNASFDGTWIYSNVIEDTPKSVEIVFRARESGSVFSSSDGSITTSSQTGFDMWLNGVSVADLSDLLENQWNHLVITHATPAATTFQLNSTDSSVDYLFFTAYPDVLSETEIELLYQVSIGLDSISVTDDPLVFSEGEFENGQAFQMFNNTWAIVGAGGN